MAAIERLTVSLPTPMADSMRAAVESGEYATPSEIVRDALRLWESRRELRARDVAALKQAWDEGKASGPARPLDVDAIIRRAKKGLKGGPPRG
jgi:antitoxin ParD1/3/4